MTATTGAKGGSRAALAGLAFFVLYLAVFILLRRIPGADATAGETADFYRSSGERRALRVAGVYLVPLGGISLLWFTAAVRHRVANLATREDALLSTVQLLSAAVYVAMIFAAMAVITAPAIAVEIGAQTPDDVIGDSSLLIVGDSILVVYALRAAGVFIAAGTTRAVRSGLIPRWFAVVSYALVVVLLLTVARVRAVSLLFPAWVAIMSVVVLIKRPDERNVGAA
jgi:hypothetical protein